ncbi:MAG: hypothetical protein HYS38_01505 [Acidobacteria bacterium]|nr:hypothetical protein [Acidobacteriota bacterium]
MRYGFYGGKRRTLEQVGQYLNITRERIRQIQVKALQQLQQNKDKMLVVCSSDSLTRWPIIRDIEWGLLREGIERREVVLPLVLDDHLFNHWQHERKADVTRKVVADFTEWKDNSRYEHSFERLLQVLTGLLPKTYCEILPDDSPAEIQWQSPMESDQTLSPIGLRDMMLRFEKIEKQLTEICDLLRR